ncbi:MAG: very short patch repair endonuclease [Bacteroidales bacterium]|nr:very short patch repair endonuclease [Bacteroidales bacterium]
MTDVHNKITRSYNMSMVKGKNTKPEIIVRKYLHSNGYRYRLHDVKLPGKPDIVLPKYKTVIFVNGCFWHGHENCKYFVNPKTRTDWWLNKINDTRKRDEHKTEALLNLGWKVYVIWDCQLKAEKRDFVFDELIVLLRKN